MSNADWLSLAPVMLIAMVLAVVIAWIENQMDKFDKRIKQLESFAKSNAKGKG